MDSESLPGSPDRQGAKAAGTSEPWVSYTCPVCGHRDGDGASLDVGSAQRLSYGHCEVVLELSASRSSQEQAAARVVVDDGGGETH
jgi:hypothetical protein